MMSAAFEQLNLALDAAPDPNAVETEVPKDETQRLLNKVCGELVFGTSPTGPGVIYQSRFEV